MFEMVNTPEPENIVFPNEKPVAVEQPKADISPQTTPQVQEAEPAEEKIAPIRKATKNNGGMASTSPAGTSANNLSVTEGSAAEISSNPIAQAETKTNYKVKLRIDPAKYTTQPQEEVIDVAEAEQTPSLTEYAATQFDNIKDGEKLQAPPKQWFELPKLAVRFEGNPLKKVLNPNE